MHPLYVHLFLNHVPIIGGVGALLLLAWGLYRHSIDVTLAALAAFVLVGLISVPVFLTGQSAVEFLDAPRQAMLAEHKDAAIAAMVGLEAAAAVALAALFVWRTTHRFPMFPAVATLILGMAATALVVRAANLGGEIAHPETRATARK